MAFFKTSESIIPNKVVEVVTEPQCEKCQYKLNLLKSKDGSVKCDKCGYSNKVAEMNNE